MKIIKIICLLLLLFVSTIVFFCINFFEMTSNIKIESFFSYIITFASISIGFNLTALSIISSSKFAVILFKHENDNSLYNYFDDLLKDFKMNIRLCFIIILLVFLYCILPNNAIIIATLYFMINILIIVTLVHFYYLASLFISFIRGEVKNASSN